MTPNFEYEGPINMMDFLWGQFIYIHSHKQDQDLGIFKIKQKKKIQKYTWEQTKMLSCTEL